MARCVDADKVIDVMKAAYWDENMHSAKDDPCVIDAMIDWSIRQVKDAPTEDVAPVVHAHWINYRGNYVSMDAHGCVDGECLCSACGDYLTASDEYGARGFYCPNCGAKMDEEV